MIANPGSKIHKAIRAGGVSGLPVGDEVRKLVQYIHQKTQGRIPIIASGGIFTGADAMEKNKRGRFAGTGCGRASSTKGPSIVKTYASRSTNTNRQLSIRMEHLFYIRK